MERANEFCFLVHQEIKDEPFLRYSFDQLGDLNNQHQQNKYDQIYHWMDKRGPGLRSI